MPYPWTNRKPRGKKAKERQKERRKRQEEERKFAHDDSALAKIMKDLRANTPENHALHRKVKRHMHLLGQHWGLRKRLLLRSTRPFFLELRGTRHRYISYITYHNTDTFNRPKIRRIQNCYIWRD
jgi:hypothetical protein